MAGLLPELGQVALILALLVSLLQAALPLAGAQGGRDAWMRVARPAAFVQLALVAGAFAILTHGFVQQDFSLRYVAENSNSLLPWYYRYTAVWGAHEGSLLLWALILAGWTGLVARFSRSLPLPVVYTGILPDLFREKQAVIATGRMQGEVFVAEEVLAKHDETYMPKEVADKMGQAHRKHDVPPAADKPAGATP